MQLRQRQPLSQEVPAPGNNPAQEDEHSGDSGSSSSSSDHSSSSEEEEYSSGEEFKPWGSKRSHKPPPARRRGPFRPQLIDLVINQVSRRYVFDAASLKALRRTCRAFKAAVDGDQGVTRVHITKKSDLEELLESPALVQRMESFILPKSWTLDIHVATKLLLIGLPNLKELTLGGAGHSVDVFACGNFSLLTSLDLRDISRSSKAVELLGKQHAWPLLELALSYKNNKIAACDLGNALARFPRLKKLCLSDMRIMRSNWHNADVGPFAEDSFCELEFLRIQEAPGLRNLGIIGTPAFPALHSLHLDFAAHWRTNETWGPFVETLVQAPWLSQLEWLELGNSGIHPGHNSVPNITPLLTALSSRALDLTHLSLTGWDFQRPLFEAIRCPAVTSLKIEMARYGLQALSPSIMADLATAALPALCTLVVCGNKATAVKYYRHWNSMLPVDANQFPALRSLTLKKLTVHNPVIDSLVSLLPSLEEFCIAKNGDEISAGAFIAALDEGAPGASFPRMRKLVLGRRFNLKDFLPAAARFPGLTHLTVGSLCAGGVSSGGLLESIVQNATAMGAWPELQELIIGYFFLSKLELRRIAEIWPAATVMNLLT